MIYRPDTGEILGVHILGLHAADLIHEASNAIALGTRVQVSDEHFIVYEWIAFAQRCLHPPGHQVCCSCTPNFV